MSSQWVSDEAALWFARTRRLIGSAAEVTDQIRPLTDTGVTDLMVPLVGAFSLPDELLESLTTDVLPGLGDVVTIAS